MKRSTLLMLYAMCLATLSLTILMAPTVSVSAAEQPSKNHLKFEVLTLAWDTYSVDAGYALAEALDEIGIKLEIKEMDDDPFYTQVYEKGYRDSFGGSIVNEYRDYEIYEMSSGFTPVPTRPYDDFHSDNDYPWGGAHSWLHNDTLDYNLDLLMNSTGSTLRNAVNNIQVICAQQLPLIPLFISSDSHLVHKDWTGFVKNPGGILTVWNIWSILNMTSTSSDTRFDMAYPSPPSHFNPFLAVDARSGWVHALIFEPLIYYDDTGQAVPWLAESFVTSTDGMSVNFTIREGVKWHDGEDFTVDDVVFSINLYASDEAATTNAYMQKIANVTVGGPENRTVIVERTEPQAWSVEDVGGLDMLPKHIWSSFANLSHADLDDPGLEENFVGTGPFNYTTGAEGGPYTFERNVDYWYNGNSSMPNMSGTKALPPGTYPKAESVKITVVSGESNRLAGIQNGDYDSERYECSNAAIEALDENPNVKLIDGGASRWDYYMIFNTAVKPLDDIVVRQAIAHAIDKEAVAEVARGDYAVVSESVLPQSFFPGWYYSATPTYSYNLALANQLLEDAGYEDADNDGIRDIPGWEPEDSPGFEFLIVMAGMLVAIPLIKKRK